MEPKDRLIRETLFLRFASRKEMLRHYRAGDPATALRRWAARRQLSPSEASARLLADEGAVALLGRQAVLEMRPHVRATPYGYARGDRGLVRKSEEARTVAAFFRMYDEGLSLRQIAEEANRQRVPTSRGGQWQASTIRYILRNPIYIGDVRRKDLVREGASPRLVDPLLFGAVQKGLTRRANRARETVQGNPSPPPV